MICRKGEDKPLRCQILMEWSRAVLQGVEVKRPLYNFGRMGAVAKRIQHFIRSLCMRVHAVTSERMALFSFHSCGNVFLDSLGLI